MDLTTITDLANSIAALGVTGILGLLFILWLRGEIHTNKEKVDWENDAKYRETLRIEAVEARKQSDQALKELAEAMRENNDLMRRSLDLNERLVEDFVSRKPQKRGVKANA